VPLSRLEWKVMAASSETLWVSAGLVKLGWGRDFYDICWLDCDLPGHLKAHRGREICLCGRHAVMLEHHRDEHGSYRGAPLPPGTPWHEWPWRPAVPVNVIPVREAS
jgi:hypothetical protein